MPCPACGENLENKPASKDIKLTVWGDKVPKAKEASGHVHLSFDDKLFCLNNHRWAIEGEIRLFREG